MSPLWERTWVVWWTTHCVQSWLVLFSKAWWKEGLELLFSIFYRMILNISKSWARISNELGVEKSGLTQVKVFSDRTLWLFFVRDANYCLMFRMTSNLYVETLKSILPPNSISQLGKPVLMLECFWTCQLMDKIQIVLVDIFPRNLFMRDFNASLFSLNGEHFDIISTHWETFCLIAVII